MLNEVSSCTRCQRLVSHLKQIRQQYPSYHNHPVNAFGDKNARLLIVGLAPGKHGANASGRPFTGDFSGQLLFRTLFEFGFANKSESLNRQDDLLLNNCLITNAVKCLPPQNKPQTNEINACNHFLQKELSSLPSHAIILALGRIAHNAVLKSFNLKQSQYPFKHLAEHQLKPDLLLIDSYHCSRYNVQTKRLTEQMFQQVFKRILELMTVYQHG